jgi:hypothetical protein
MRRYEKQFCGIHIYQLVQGNDVDGISRIEHA